ncbi:ABC transporter permease subunit [Granulicella tundricola]|uniref:Binding-protein-dependent transport systems inner membrane component n=1 Tax=Granulicella tundricola (strain ATCC BAA-1859 / DSM 23138 / MP5ACTX9) TaxID=1198114 RepID=E8WZ02_GRATM|nr:ABC transporter permease subunit [Granulicella tundricola]ADW69917.1 binding-protein-dependent transport systems inner membrane component [Granulicella tundricola MP5ACTX9]
MRMIVLGLLCGLALLSAGVVLHAHGGYAIQDRDSISTGTSAMHWTGTDDLGRDRTVRVAAALLLGLAGALLASALATTIAVGVGVTAAFAPEGIASLLMYASDLFLTLPWLFLLMMVRSSLPLTMPPLQSAGVTFLLLALLGWPAYVRVSYAGARNVRNAEWMLQGRASGLRTSQLATRHLLPHLRPLLLSQFLVCIPACLVAEANLGTLGLGISEPLPSWGSMLLSLQNSAVLASSHWVYLPIVLLVIVLLLLELLVFEVS